MNLGDLHSLDGCPEAPFVVCVGDDLARDNLRVWDVRESAAVRASFGGWRLRNPLGADEFRFATADEADAAFSSPQQQQQGSWDRQQQRQEQQQQQPQPTTSSP